MNVVKANNIDEAWLRWYEILKEKNQNIQSRDGEVVGEELCAVTIIEDPTKCIMQNRIRKMPMRYAIGELLWYLSANNSLKEIQKYTSAWDRMSDDGKTVNSNYGFCMKYKFGFNQVEYVIDMLKENPESRQAVIHIKDANYTKSKDVNCTCYLQFLIRDGKLEMHTHMRSNDLWLGFPYDVFQFTCIQIFISMRLGVELGNYIHIADSLHFYKRDFLKALENKKKAGEEDV